MAGAVDQPMGFTGQQHSFNPEPTATGGGFALRRRWLRVKQERHRGGQRRGTRGPRLVALWLIAVVVTLSSCSGKEPPSNSVSQVATPAAAGDTKPAASPTLTPELVAENNRGVALLGQFDYQAAYDLFAGLVRRQPGWSQAKVNLAIAQLNLNRPASDDLAKAQSLLRQVLAADPQNLPAHYCLGILLFNGSEIHAALEQFQLVAKADPSDAFAAYFTARCLFEDDKFADALTWYRTSMR